MTFGLNQNRCCTSISYSKNKPLSNLIGVLCISVHRFLTPLSTFHITSHKRTVSQQKPFNNVHSNTPHAAPPLTPLCQSNHTRTAIALLTACASITAPMFPLCILPPCSLFICPLLSPLVPSCPPVYACSLAPCPSHIPPPLS